MPSDNKDLSFNTFWASSRRGNHIEENSNDNYRANTSLFFFFFFNYLSYITVTFDAVPGSCRNLHLKVLHSFYELHQLLEFAMSF